MLLKHRCVDIKELQTQVLQSYLILELGKRYEEKEWRNSLEKYLAVKAKDSPNIYAGTYQKMISLGIDNFNVTDMDCSILSVILSDKDSPLNKCRYYLMDKDINTLIQPDRNIDAHKSGSESADDIFLWACGTLYDLKKFIKIVLDKRGDYTENEKKSFAQTNYDRIKKLQRSIVSDYQEEIKFDIIWDDEVKRIQAGNRILKYNEALQKYLRDPDCNISFRFAFYCADRGVAHACFAIANYLFTGIPSSAPLEDDLKEKLKQDYKKAAEYYKNGFVSIEKDSEWAKYVDSKHFYTEEKIRYVSLCKNNIIDGLKQEECDNYIREHRNEIEEYKAGDYTFYRYKN